MQFLGLQIGDKVPDEKTIWLFKEQLKEKKLEKRMHYTLFALSSTICPASFLKSFIRYGHL